MSPHHQTRVLTQASESVSITSLASFASWSISTVWSNTQNKYLWVKQQQWEKKKTPFYSNIWKGRGIESDCCWGTCEDQQSRKWQGLFQNMEPFFEWSLMISLWLHLWHSCFFCFFLDPRLQNKSYLWHLWVLGRSYAGKQMFTAVTTRAGMALQKE